MGRLAGFDYREITRRLKSLGFAFQRHGKGSHEVGRRAGTGRMTTIPNHRGDLPEGTVKGILDLGGVSVGEFLAAK